MLSWLGLKSGLELESKTMRAEYSMRDF